MDPLSDEDVRALSMLPINEIDHSFSPILRLALVALVLARLGTMDRMTTSLGASVGLTIFALFRAGTDWAIVLCF